MVGKSLDRRRRAGMRVAGSACAVLALYQPLPAIAGENAAPPGSASLWTDVLETLDFKAKPAGPAPDFVEKTRPDPSGLHYVPQPLQHAVSPLAVKTPAQIEAKKAALDDAQKRQLQPVPPPVDLTKKSKDAKSAKTKSAADVD